MASSELLTIPAERLAGLRRYNLIAGIFHLAQAIAIIALSNSFAFGGLNAVLALRRFN